MRKVEILAPAGSYESLKGAINGGCDAVYLGGSKFGARAFAHNLDEDMMLRAIDYVHLFDKKLYLTVNTLLHNEELEEELYRYLEKYYTQGLDAVIVQDTGVLSFLHRNFPKLPIHASTQMTLTSEKGGEILKDYGVTRFVPSRELGIDEIRHIRKQTSLEIETFVHGALCYCYSGQCFLSSMIGERSGNRGRCAQPCRMPYQVFEQDGRPMKNAPYVLSPKDMCTLDKIPDLVDSGIDSFKIEGRMKKPEYASYTAFLYRKYVDLYLEYGDQYQSYLRKHQKQLEYDYTCLMDLYNRGGFHSGYFYDYNGSQIMSMVRPNHSGVKVGTVEKMQKNRAVIQLEQDIYAQDVLEFRKQEGTVLYEYTVKNDVDFKEERKTETNTKPGSQIISGTEVYRTRRNALLKQIETKILENQKKVSVDFYFHASVGEEMQLTCVSGVHSVTLFGPVAEEAKNQPMSKEKIQKQFGKLNTTLFKLQHCDVLLEGNVFIPVGQLNELRREAVEQLEQTIVKSFYREQPIEQPREKLEYEGVGEKTTFVVSASNAEQAKVAETFNNVSAIYCDLGIWEEGALLRFAEQTEKNLYFILPAVLRRKDYAIYECAMKAAFCKKQPDSTLAKLLCHEKVKGFLIKNFEEYALYRDFVEPYGKKEAILDYNMYTFNQEAKAFWREHNIVRSTASIELNGYEWKKNGCNDQDIIVYGQLPLMTSVQCVVKNTKGCKKTPEVHAICGKIRGKFENEFQVRNCCNYCYNQIYERVPLSLHEYAEELIELSPIHFRMDFVGETEEETREIIQYYMNVFSDGVRNERPVWEYTTGHYRKGVK